MSRCRSGPSDAAARFIAASASCCGSYLVHMGLRLSAGSRQADGNFIRMNAGSFRHHLDRRVCGRISVNTDSEKGGASTERAFVSGYLRHAGVGPFFIPTHL